MLSWKPVNFFYKNIYNHRIKRGQSYPLSLRRRVALSYAPYNGAIEHAFKELKEQIRMKMKLDEGKAPAEHFDVYAQNAAYELNHKPRKALKGKHACYELARSKKRTFNKKERRTVYDCIYNITNDILCSIEYPKVNTFDKAWRIAVEYWLQKKGFITITINKKVLPCFLPKKISLNGLDAYKEVDSSCKIDIVHLLELFRDEIGFKAITKKVLKRLEISALLKEMVGC